MLTIRTFRGGVLQEDHVVPSRLEQVVRGGDARVWVDATDPGEEELELLHRVFDLHPLSIEDTRRWGQRSKVEIFPNYLFVVVHALRLDAEGEIVDDELHLFHGDRFVVTAGQATTIVDVGRVAKRIARRADTSAERAWGYLLYVVLDEIVDGYLSIVETLEERSDDVEERVFAQRQDPMAVQQDVFRLKRRVVRFRRVVAPLREVLDLIRDESDVVTPELAPYYRDVQDHVIRALEFADNIREMLTTALEAQLSQVSNRLNVVMKKLTAWAGIILVPTLIAGIYGMNFQDMPELDWRFGYPMALGVMGLSALVLYRVFKQRDWL